MVIAMNGLLFEGMTRALTILLDETVENFF